MEKKEGWRGRKMEKKEKEIEGKDGERNGGWEIPQSCKKKLVEKKNN